MNNSAFPNPSRLSLFMLEKGIFDEYEQVTLELLGLGDQKGWRHKKLNQWAEAPVLELPDGTTLSEAAAIAQYLDEAHPGRKLLGETALERASDRQWDNRIFIQLLYRLVTAFHVLVSRRTRPIHSDRTDFVQAPRSRPRPRTHNQHGVGRDLSQGGANHCCHARQTPERRPKMGSGWR